MKWFSRLFWLLLLIAAFGLALLTVNQQQVHLTFLDWKTPELSVFWWLLMAFALGLSLGLLPAMINSAKHVMQRGRLKKEIKVRDKEIAQLREVKSSEEQLAAEQQASVDSP